MTSLTERVDEGFDFVFGQRCLFDIFLYLREHFPTVTIEAFGELIDLVDFLLE